MSAEDTAGEAVKSGQTLPPKPRPTEISGAQRRYLRAKAHSLKPVVFVGKSGINEGVISATQEALKVHELIKVSAPSEGGAQRREIADSLAEQTGSHVAQTIGHVIVLFRQKVQRSEFKLPQKEC